MKLAPITQKRWNQFRSRKRAYISLWLFVAIYLISLSADFLCNNQPLYVRVDGTSCYPALMNLFGRSYPEDLFLQTGNDTRPDYHNIATNDIFLANPDNTILFPIIPHGPYESERIENIPANDDVTITLSPVPTLATISIRPDMTISRATGAGALFSTNDHGVKGLTFTDYWNVNPELFNSLSNRLANLQQPPSTQTVYAVNGEAKAVVTMRAYTPRSSPPRTVRLRIATKSSGAETSRLNFTDSTSPPIDLSAIWPRFSDQTKSDIRAAVTKRMEKAIEPQHITIGGTAHILTASKADVYWPHHPVSTHYMGLDRSGRDVTARVLYGTRLAISFGLALTLVTTVIGIFLGAIQGYFGGKTDLLGQRFIEIWASLPFLYIIILMGSIFGQSFGLLLAVYSVFAWIGISYYSRAEFLRLRKQAFVESAIGLGLPTRTVIFRHILPNSLTPIITILPFTLVGAIGVLASLDYLGFGLPSPTPSWGELFDQAQQYRHAWWLVAYPAAALFITILLGVFIGEGVRDAFDPRKYSEMK